jgi:hypothetical protein
MVQHFLYCEPDMQLSFHHVRPHASPPPNQPLLVALVPHILPIGDRIATLKLKYATLHQLPPLTCLHSPASSLPPTPILSHTCIPRASPSMRGSHAPPPHAILFAHTHWSYDFFFFFFWSRPSLPDLSIARAPSFATETARTYVHCMSFAGHLSCRITEYYMEF